MKAAEISPTRLKASRTLIAMAHRMWQVATGRLTAIVRTAEIAAGAVDAPVVVDEIADAAGAVDVPVAADEIADAAGRAGEGTKNLSPRIFTDSHGYKKRPRRESWPFFAEGKMTARSLQGRSS